MPPTLESAFRLHYLEDGIARLRFGMWTGLLLFGAFACWDITTFPPDVLPWSLAIRLGIACPLTGMVLYATRRAWSPATLDALRLVMAYGIGISVVAITALVNASGWEAQPHGLFLIAVAAYTITGMRTPQATTDDAIFRTRAGTAPPAWPSPAPAGAQGSALHGDPELGWSTPSTASDCPRYSSTSKGG